MTYVNGRWYVHGMYTNKCNNNDDDDNNNNHNDDDSNNSSDDDDDRKVERKTKYMNCPPSIDITKQFS